MKCMTCCVVALTAAMLFLGGCEDKNKTSSASATKTSTVSMGAMNDRCPLTKEPVNKNAPTATYQGKTVAFCCGGCAAKFNAMSDADKAATVASLSK
jgi:hypothetical protein